MTKPPDLSPLNPKGTWRTYTTAEGLAGLQTEHIAEDAEGYLWIGIWGGGASRFDGDEFCTFTTRDGLPSNRVFAIHLDQQGRLWFGTDGGVCWYDGKEFHRFDQGDGVSDKLISFIFEDQEGRVWCAGSEALGYYDGSFHDLVPAYYQQHGQPPYAPREYDECEGIAQDCAGHLWFAFITNLVRYDGEDFHHYGAEHGLPPGRRTVGTDAAGDLWIGAGGALYRCEGQTFQPVPIEIKAQWIRKIQHDQEGRTWFCTGDRGAFCCDGTHFHHFTPQDGLAYSAVNAVFQDREGQLWFATWGGGLSCFDPQSIQVLDEKDGLPFNTVTTLAADHQGRIWVGFGVDLADSHKTSEVVSCYDGERLTTFGQQEGMGSCLTLYMDSRDRLWCGGLGLRQYESGRFRNIAVGEELEKVYVWTIAEDRKGHLFIGYMKDASTSQEFFGNPLQLTRYDGQKFQTLLTREKTDPYTYISALVAGRGGGIWFALGSWNSIGPGEGLGWWHETKGIRYYTAEDGLVDNRVTDLTEDSQGHLWITTSGGISRFDGERFRNFTVADGLPSNRVHCACQDQQGHLWFGTDNGVVCCDGHTFQTIRSPQITSVNDLLQDRQGNFWFATNKGLVRYLPGQVPPRVRILQVVAGQVYEGVEEINTSSPQIAFEYKGLSFRTPPKDMLYTYRLQGYEEEWQKPTRSMRALYQDLPLGEYTFQVRAIDRDLNYSEPASVRLKVIPDPRDRIIDELEQRVRERTRELDQANQRLLREAAAERVRSEALSMRSSEDLPKVVAVMWQEMVKLGVETPACSFQFISEPGDYVTVHLAFENPVRGGEAPVAPEIVAVDERTLVRRWETTLAQLLKETGFSDPDFIEHWRAREPWSVTCTVGSTEIAQSERQLGIAFPPALWAGEWIVTNVPFQYGTVGFRERQYSEEHIAIVQEFTSALELGYLRFLDFQRLEEQNRALEQANAQIQEANQHKSQFLSRMSHDLRTPMNAIIGYTRILLRKAKDALDERQYRNLENIQLSAARLLSLINDILDLSRIEAGRIDLRPEPVDLNQLIAQCAASVESLLKPGVELKQEIADLAPLHTDADRLNRVLMNLLSNAVKFTEQGSITVSAQSVDGTVELAVADTGIGIPAEDLPYIFEEFRQSGRRGEGEKQGSGLGLAIARKSVELLGGSISVESQVGKGTKFSLRIADYNL